VGYAVGVDLRGAWAHESGFVGEDDGLGAVAQVEFHQHAGEVRLDGGLADEQRAGDLASGNGTVCLERGSTPAFAGLAWGPAGPRAPPSVLSGCR
jgi:hypothetical protein